MKICKENNHTPKPTNTTDRNKESLLDKDGDVEDEETEQLKDKLFIETGEDMIDTFAAFKHYGLKMEE